MIRLQGPLSLNSHFSASPIDGKKKLMPVRNEKKERNPKIGVIFDSCMMVLSSSALFLRGQLAANLKMFVV
jgi:hypothetical protein